MGLTRTFVPYEDQYTQIPNLWLRDARLSRRARGLLAEVMSHRVGWRVTVAGLQRTGPEGRDAIRATIQELIGCGYLRRSQEQGESGRFNEVEYEVCDPFTADGKHVSGGFAVVGPSDGGSPDVGQPAPIEEHHLEDQSLEHHGEELAHGDAAGVLGGIEVDAPTDVVLESFLRLWKAWPRSESRKTALTSYRRAARTVRLVELETASVAWARGAAAVIAAAPNPDEQKRATPYLASWLNAERWIEAPPVPAVRATAARGEAQRSDLTRLAEQLDNGQAGIGYGTARREITS